MRQAGRYLPEYQEVRKRHAFQEMCTRPELAVEVSLQPLRRFGFDAAIVFYDILFLVEAMGAPLEFTEEGPRFRRSIATAADVRALRAPDVREPRPESGTGAVLESLRELRRQAPPETAVIGFAGAPFTLAAYLAEGSARRPGERLRRLIHEDPATARLLLERLTEATGEYVAAQAAAGAEVVQLFDTWAGVLAPAEYREFALPYQQAVFARLAAAGVPAILYVNGSAHLLDEMVESRAAVLSLDWRHGLAAARRRLGAGVALQGNLDPAALFASPEAVRRRTAALLESMRGDPGYVVNLGHGITPETPLASVEAFVEAVKSFRP
jgi:uroporphyrinogen decarboxylase